MVTRSFNWLQKIAITLTPTNLVWLLVICAASIMSLKTSAIAYGPDSWSYVDIARSFIEPERGIGSIFGNRDFLSGPWWNDSFPFLWPLILAPGISIWGPASPVGAYLFLPIWLTTCFIFARTIKYFKINTLLAPAIGLALLALPGYVNEGIGGRAIPLNILLVSFTLLNIVKIQVRSSISPPILIGVSTGLCAANRFDSVLVGPIIMTVAYIFGFMNRKQTTIAVLAWIPFPSIWVLYSSLRLGGLYITDNSRVALSPTNTGVTTWWGDLRSDGTFPMKILQKMNNNLASVADSLFLAYRYWVIALLISISLVVLASRTKRWKTKRYGQSDISVPASLSEKKWLQLFSTVILTLGVVQGLILLSTGYKDDRYWATIGLVCLEFTIVIWFKLSIAQLPLFKFVRNRPLKQIISLFLIILCFFGLYKTHRQYTVESKLTNNEAKLIFCLKKLNSVAMIPGIEAFRLPAITDLRISYVPYNFEKMSTQDWRELKKEFGVGAWVDPSEHRMSPIPLAARSVLSEVKCF